MGPSKLLRVLIVFGLLVIIILIFSETIIKNVTKPLTTEITPQPSVQITLATTPGLYWMVFDNPSSQHSFMHRAMYNVEQVIGKNEDYGLVFARYTLSKDKDLLADLTLTNEDYSSKKETEFKAKETADKKLSVETIAYFEGEGTLYSLSEQKQVVDALVIIKNTQEKKNFNIVVKNFKSWVNYPNDVIRIAQSFKFY